MKVSKTELIRQIYGNGLYHALAAEGMSPEKCAELANQYDKLTSDKIKMSGEGASNIIYSGYGSQKPVAGSKTIKNYVESKLAELNGTHPGVETNGRTRFVSAVRTFNENVSRCGGILLDGVELDKEPIESEAKIKIPNCFQSPVVSESRASDDGGKVWIKVII